LLEEEELHDAADADLGSQFLARGFQSRRLPPGQLACPSVPALPGMALAQGIEQNKVFQPPAFSPQKPWKR